MPMAKIAAMATVSQDATIFDPAPFADSAGAEVSAAPVGDAADPESNDEPADPLAAPVGVTVGVEVTVDGAVVAGAESSTGGALIGPTASRQKASAAGSTCAAE